MAPRSQCSSILSPRQRESLACCASRIDRVTHHFCCCVIVHCQFTHDGDFGWTGGVGDELCVADDAVVELDCTTDGGSRDEYRECGTGVGVFSFDTGGTRDYKE